ncbi:MAG: hypothetical protein ACTSSG_11340 [Candidatus Heimdallarchaeaceae archaeon]
MSDWATILSAFITAFATIVAIIIAWILTKRSLYNYQYKQDLKKTEVKLIKNVMDAKFKLNESIILLFISKQKMIPSSIQEDEAIVRFLNSFSGFDLLLEEIKTELTMSLSTQKKYKQKMSDLIRVIIELTNSEIINDWYTKLSQQIDLINSIFNDLIQFIHRKISKQLKEFN